MLLKSGIIRLVLGAMNEHLDLYIGIWWYN